MSYQVIARKYRPQTFAEVVGQEHITRTLQNAILENRIHHAYLFTGIRGIGKTTLARILSKALNCKSPVKSPLPEPCNKCPACLEITNGASIDIQEIDGASNTGVDDVRELRERVKFLPSSGKYKIYIIDEVHMLSTAAFNALLKTLEEPPPHVLFIFATTESHKIPATILSRCQRYDFRRIPSPKIVESLEMIAKQEGVETDADALQIVAQEADGSMRDAESLFDQAIAFAGKKLTYNHLKDLLGFLDRGQMEAVIKAIVSHDAKKALDVAGQLFISGEDINRFMSGLLESFHNLLIIRSCGDVELDSKGVELSFIKGLAGKTTVEECQQWFNLIYRGCEDISRTKFPKTIMDVLLVNMALVKPVRPIDDIIQRLDQLSAPQQPARPAVQGPSSRPVEAEEETPPPTTPTSSDRSSEFFDWVKLNRPQIGAFVGLSSGGTLSDGKLTIRFAQKSFAFDRLSEEDTRAFVEKLALDFFKRPVKVEVVLESGGGGNIDQAVLKKQKLEETAQKHKILKENALKNDDIREAANIFGAEIREIKIKQ